MNYRDPSKTDNEETGFLELEKQNEIFFKFRKVSEEICPVVTVGAVFKEKKHNDYVFLLCYLCQHRR